MGELLPYYALFYAFGLLLMALFVRLFWSKKKENDINRIKVNNVFKDFILSKY